MPVTGFILINVASGKVRTVCENLQKLKGITETYMMHGDYKIIVKIRVDLPQSINDLINRIQKIQYILKVDPLIGLRYLEQFNFQENIDSVLEL